MRLFHVDIQLFSSRKGIKDGATSQWGIPAAWWAKSRRMFIPAIVVFRKLCWSGLDTPLPAGNIRNVWWKWTIDRQSIPIPSIHSQRTQWTRYPLQSLLTMRSEKFHRSLRFPNQCLVILTTHLQLFNYIVEGFIAYTGFDKRMKEELQICFTSMPSQKLNTISISDFLYLIDVFIPSSMRVLIH